MADNDMQFTDQSTPNKQTFFARMRDRALNVREPVVSLSRVDGALINAATSDKQPQLGVVGQPSPDVLTIQGSTSMVPIDVNVKNSVIPTGAALDTTVGATNTTLNATNTALATLHTDLSGVASKLGTAAAQTADITTLTAAVNNVRAAIQAQIDLASSVWTDTAGNFYLLVQKINEGTGVLTSTIYNPVTSAVISSTPTGFAPYGGSGGTGGGVTQKPPIQKIYRATANGTGYSAGEYLGSVTIVDDSSGSIAILAGGWVNLTQHTLLSGNPTGGTFIAEDQAIPSLVSDALATTAAFQGSFATIPPALPAGSSGLLGIMQAIGNSLLSLLQLNGVQKTTGTLAAGGNSVVLSGGPYGTFGFKLVGTSTQIIVAFGTRDGTTYDVPLGISTEGVSAGNTSGTTLAVTGAGPFFGYVEAAGCSGVMLYTSSYTSGTLAVTLTATAQTRSVRIKAPLTDPAWVATTPYGIGDSFYLSTAHPTTNGVAVGSAPAGARSITWALPPGASISYAMKGTAPSSAPTGVITRANPSTVTLDFEEPIAGTEMMYVTDWTAGTGSLLPVGRFL